MKIFTATFFENNYGSALQAFALQQKIKELGGDPVLIGRKANTRKIGIAEKFRLFFRPEKHYGPVRKIRRYFQRKVYTEKAKKINKFLVENTTVMPYAAAVKEMEKGNCVLLAGSDQVWSTLNHTIDGFYLFDYIEKEDIRKVSYAASIGISEISDKQRAYYRDVLKPFDVVSFREKAAYELLKDTLVNRTVRQDVDPTLLFDGEFWKNLVPQREHNKKFLFVYMLRPSKEVIHIARKLAKAKGLEIIYMGLYTNHYRGIHTISNAGVEDFLYYIHDAEIVVTNSFHGTVFSLLFEKHFASVRIASTASRAESLLDIVGLQDHLVDDESDISAVLNDYDYGKVRERLAEKREDSIRYLKSIVQEQR